MAGPSRNPYKQAITQASTGTEQQREVQHSRDSEKQVASSELLSGPENAPTPGEPPTTTPHSPLTVREADKEVTASWQLESQGQSGPIPMTYHESNSPVSPVSPANGPPPAYDSIAALARQSGSTLTSITTPTSLEPDSPNDDLPPRPEDKSAVSHLLGWVPPPPRSPPSVRLVQPVVIPQLDVPPARERVPFQRSYSDALAAHGVSMQDFTRFLDGLEVAQLPTAALQGLRMFGVGISQLSIPILGPLTGNGISALASSGSGNSGTRARMYLEQARERYFKPRGLRVTIVRDEELDPRLQKPSHVPRLGTLTRNTLPNTTCQRRLEALGPYTAPLRFDVPDPDQQIQGVQKLARKHLQSRLKTKTKRLELVRQRQWAHTSLTADAFDERYRSKLFEIRTVQEALIRSSVSSGVQGDGYLSEEKLKELRLRQHELQLIVSERHNQGKDDVALAAEMEENNWAKRLEWLVIESV